LHVFPRLAPVACFPALGTGCMISLDWQQLYIDFPKLGTAKGGKTVSQFTMNACFVQKPDFSKKSK